jgi:hypothetical protein
MEQAAWTPGDFVLRVIDPALAALALDPLESRLAVRQLLLGTALQESLLRHLRQLPNQDGSRGPALGYFQMEPATHDDIWKTFLAFRAPLAARVRVLAGLAAGQPKAEKVAADPVYAAAMARLHYRRAPGRLPEVGDVAGMAAYWKRHYNTPLGRGVPAEFAARLARALPLLDGTRLRTRVNAG